MSVSLSRVDGPGDAELIAAVRGGDVDAYGELFARHVDAARRLAGQLAGPGDADDLVSDAFTKVLLVLQRGGGPDLAFRAYLLTAVRRLHVDRIRSTSRLRPVDDLTPFDPGVPFHDTAVEGFDNATAAKAFASLPERWQMVLWHTEVEQQKPADIAVLLGMSANSVSALAYRAREGLRQAFLSMHAADPDDVDCSWTRDHLGAYVRGGLSRRDVGRVDDHLESCRACAAVYLELTEVNSGLSALLAPLLLGTAGAAYLSGSGGAAGTGAGLSAAWTATRSWIGGHTVVTAVGGVVAASVASVAIYVGAQTILANPAADTADGAGASGLHSLGQSGGPGGPGDAQGDPRSGGSNPTGGTDPSLTGSPSTATDSPSVPTASDSSTDVLPTEPGTDPATDPGTDPGTGPGTDPGGNGPGTDPGGNDPGGPTDPGGGGGAVQFTSTPPADPEFGSTYRLAASGGSGKGIVFSIAPATTNHACSLDDAGTTATFDHAGTCVIAAHATNRSAARALRSLKAADDVIQRIVVPKGRQSITLSAAPDLARVAGPAHTVTVKAGRSGEDVVLSSNTPGVCTVSGRRVSFEHAGPCEIAADQAGNDDYRPAPTVTDRFEVHRGLQDLAFTLTSDRAVTRGTGALAVTASGDSGNPVTFSPATPDRCSVAGSAVSFDHAGTCTVEAHQDGNDDYLGANATRTIAVDRADQQLRFQLAGSAQVGDTLPLDATPGASGEPVTFTVDDAQVCSLNDAGTAVTFHHARPCAVTAHQAGDADYTAAPPVTQPVDVAKGDQHLAFTFASDQPVVRGTGTLTVTASGASGNPVTFRSTTPQACSVDGTTVSFRHAATCSVEATQAGDADYNAADAVSHGLDVGKADQEITFAPVAGAVVGHDATLQATSTSGLPVTFALDPAAGNDACTVTGSVVSFLHARPCVVNATQVGNDDVTAASASQTISIAKAPQQVAFTSIPPSGARRGDTFVVSATGGPSGNAVTFGSASPAVCTVAGSTVTLDHTGTCVVTADQAGDDDYLAAPTITQTVAVAKAPQAITFTSTPPENPRLGTTYAVTATGGASGNPVTFASGSPAVCTVSGSTVTFRHAGTCVVTADQAGNDDYTAAPTRTQTVAVAKAPQSITFTSKQPASPAFGDTYAVSATGGDSGNPVKFSVAQATTNGACTVIGSTVTFRHAGTCVIAADQAGNDDYTAAPTQTQSVDVGKASQVVTITSKAPAGAVVGGTYTMAATSGSGEPVTFSVAPATTNSACTVSGSTVDLRHVGTCVIAANQAGNADYLPAPTVTQAFSVAQGPQSITFTSTPPSPGRVGTTYTATATSTSGLPVTFSADPAAVCTVTTTGVVTFKGPGDCVLRADQAGNADFQKAPTATQKTTVSETRRDLTMSITTHRGLLFGIFGTVVDVQVLGLDPGAHATLSMFAQHAIALVPASCDANGGNNHAQCDVTSTPTTFSFLALPFQSDPRLDFEVSSKDSQDSNPDNNKQSVDIGN